MWVFSPRGFYSVVQKYEDRRDDMVTVRARRKEDLTKLADLLPNAKPYRKRYSDYPWRLRCPREDWAFAVAKMAMEIDYANFKDRVLRTRGGDARSQIYHNVWCDLLALERRRPHKTRSAKTAKRDWFSFKPGDDLIVQNESAFGVENDPWWEEQDLLRDGTEVK